MCGPRRGTGRGMSTILTSKVVSKRLSPGWYKERNDGTPDTRRGALDNADAGGPVSQCGERGRPRDWRVGVAAVGPVRPGTGARSGAIRLDYRGPPLARAAAPRNPPRPRGVLPALLWAGVRSGRGTRAQQVLSAIRSIGTPAVELKARRVVAAAADSSARALCAPGRVAVLGVFAVGRRRAGSRDCPVARYRRSGGMPFASLRPGGSPREGSGVWQRSSPDRRVPRGHAHR